MALYITLDNFEFNRFKKNAYSSILDKNFKNKFNNLSFSIQKQIPFYTEIKTVIKFISAKTSLDIIKWFKIEDIKRTLLTAKYKNIEYKKKVIGYEQKRSIKNLVFALFFSLLFLILCAPLLAFSHLNFFIKKNDLTYASFSLKVN